MSFLIVIVTSNVLILLILLVTVLYLYFKWSFTYWSSRGVTAPPCSFPLGNLNDVALGRVTLQEMFKPLYTELKPKGIKYSGFYLLHQPILVVFDLELIKSIMVKDFSHFTDHGLYEIRDYDPFSGHLFALKGAEWKNMREKLTPIFTSGKLKMMIPTIEKVASNLVNLVDRAAKNSETLDIKDIAGRYTTDVIASVAFGIEVNSLKNPNSDFRKHGESALGHSGTMSKLRLVSQMMIPDLVKFLKIPVMPTAVGEFFLDIVQNTIKYREENGIIRKDFMQLMIQLKNNIDISDQEDDYFNLQVNSDKNMENKNNLTSISNVEIAAQTFLFFVAGFDTASLTTSFCLFELAVHKDIQEKLRNEITTVLNKHEGELTYNAIMEMTYMDKCIKETLRKYPILSSLFRLCTKTYQVPNSDLIIEKGMVVFIPINELHYDPEYYPNPEKFDPERFSKENIAARNTYTWLPFGEGPRFCLGLRLGMIEIKVALTKLLSDFRYSLDSRTTYPLKRLPRSLLLAAEGGIWLNVEKIIK